MTFKEKLASEKFLITVEIGPEKGIQTKKLLEEAEIVRSKADAVNVTDLQSSVMRLGSLVSSYMLKQKGFEPIYQLTCRDRNRLALQSDLLSAGALGIENVLISTGDHPAKGDHPQAKPVFDLDSVQLIQAASGLRRGRDMNNNQLCGQAPNFCLGAVVNPGAEPPEPQIIKMEKKISAGADFFQTQAVFDLASFENFMSKIKHIRIPIIAGIVLLKSASMANYMNNNVAGISVPEKLIKKMADSSDRQATSIEIASALIKQIRPMCRGVHIMPIGWTRLIPSLLAESDL